MLSKNKEKTIKSLHKKKYRKELSLYLCEWEKNLEELLLSNIKYEDLFISYNFYTKYSSLLENKKYDIIDDNVIQKISTMQTNSSWVAVIKQKPNNKLNIAWEEIVLVLDEIKDPWNLWTIIRLCDWYWIKKIICSDTTCEYYNPKVINSTMWSFLRVDLYYTDLVKYLWDNKNHKIYWALLDWENIHKVWFSKSWFIVIWNESTWISKEVQNFLTDKITIVKIWQAESLNAWVATGIILDNVFRKD